MGPVPLDVSQMTTLAGHRRIILLYRCRLIGVKRTWQLRAPRSGNDSKRALLRAGQHSHPIQGYLSASSWEMVRVSAAKFSGLNQPAAIDRFFCKLDCLLGRERVGWGCGFVEHRGRDGNPNFLAV
jgi:hypothetical protein